MERVVEVVQEEEEAIALKKSEHDIHKIKSKDGISTVKGTVTGVDDATSSTVGVGAEAIGKAVRDSVKSVSGEPISDSESMSTGTKPKSPSDETLTSSTTTSRHHRKSLKAVQQHLNKQNLYHPRPYNPETDTIDAAVGSGGGGFQLDIGSALTDASDAAKKRKRDRLEKEKRQGEIDKIHLESREHFAGEMLK